MANFYDAFISYGRADSKAFAQKFQACLDERGFKIWFDFNDIPLAVDFQNQIDDGIEKAHNFLFIIAPHSVNSAYCLKEIELAIKLNKRIIPLLHVMKISQETWQERYPKGRTDDGDDWEAYKAKGLHESYQNMHPIIRRLNWVYFQEGINDFEKSLADLIAVLNSHHNYVEQHTQLLVKALEWERHQKQTSYLLVGEEKQQAEAWLNLRFKDEQAPCVPIDLHCEYITESIKNGNNLMTEVFLAYADEDRETMEKVRRSLMREGITVWTNRKDILTGETFQEAIDRGIEKADNFVYLLSPDSLNSTFCRQELGLAFSLNKRIIPILVRATDPMQVPSVLRELHYINIADNEKREDYQLDESELLRILHQDAAYYNQHKILLAKALKWARQQNNPSILLRGYNLRSAETWLKGAQTRRKHPPTPLQKEFIGESLRQPPLESLDVFISYSRADSDLARKLNDNLQMQGKTTWFDQESIASGTDFQQEIFRGIRACDNFLFILSPRAVNSPYCKDEVEYAASLNKRFVTVLHQEVNTGDLHPELAKVQWIDFNGHQRDFNANFNQLVRTLDTDREHLHSHTIWLQRALEWEKKERSDDLLLRGSEFIVAREWLQETEEQKKKPGVTQLQKEFIEASQKGVEEEKRRQAEMQRSKAQLAQQKKIAKLQKYFLVTVSTLFVVAVGASVAVVSLWQEAESLRQEVAEGQIKALSRVSLLLSSSDRKFDPLLEGLRARKILKELNTDKYEIKEPVLTALQAAVYKVGEKYRERNQLTEHQSLVHSIAFSPDGQRIASTSWDKTVKLWNSQGKLLQTLQGHQGRVNGVAFSPDGQTLASASEDKTIKLWNLQGELLQTFQGHHGSVLSVTFSPDGQRIASASWDKTIKLWNSQGQLLQTLQGHETYLHSITFSPDGQRIASASWDKTIKLWNSQGQLLQTLQGHEGWVLNVAFSPDGQKIASASQDTTIKLWNSEGQLLQTLQGHQGWVNSVAFSPDGQKIASASQDTTIKLWNSEGQLLQTLQGHQGQVLSVAFSSDSKTIASGSQDTTIKLWNFEGKQLQTLQGHKDRVSSVAFSPDGQTIASASGDNTVKIWNLERELLHTLLGHEDRVSSVAFSPDGQTIASASGDNTVKIWNLEGELLHTLLGHEDEVIRVIFSPKGDRIASASMDDTIKLWNLGGELLHSLQGHQSMIWSIAFSPDSKAIASASMDDTIKLWNLQGELLHTLQGHQGQVWSVAFSPNSKMIASASLDATVKLWNLQGELLHTLQGHQGAVWSVAFSPDGQKIASASQDTTTKLWNLEGKLLRTLQGHQNVVWKVAFSPDSKTIASASGDKTIKLWNLEGELLHTLRGDKDFVVFSPDSKMIAVAGRDNIVILWKLADLTLDSLMRDACVWVGDYLKYNAPQGDRTLCDDY